MMKIQDIITYTNKNGNINQTEYISYEDPEKKIEKKFYNGKPYWRKTERKTLFRKHVSFEKPIKKTKTRKIDRKLTPFPFPKKKVNTRERKQRKNGK